MKMLFSVGLLFLLTACSQAAPRCHLSELWSCAEIAIDWLHSLPKRQIPETDDDLEIMCNELTKAMDCGFSYRDNCSTPLQKELIGLFVEGGVELQRDFCSPGSSLRAKYLSHSVCLNKVSQMDEIKEQIEYILAVLEKGQSVSAQEAITYSCCGYSKVMNAFMKLGRDNCGQEAVDAAVELMSVAIAQLPEVICNGFDGEEDKCKSVLPPDGSKPSDGVKESASYKFIRDTLKNWLD